KEFKLAFAIDSRSLAAVRTVATFYFVNGRGRDAEPFLQAYAATGTAATLVLADFYLGDGRIRDAAAVLEPLTKATDGFVPAKLRLAAIDFQQNRRQAAYKTIEEILKREPANEQTLEMKARFFVQD